MGEKLSDTERPSISGIRFKEPSHKTLHICLAANRVYRPSRYYSDGNEGRYGDRRNMDYH